MEAEKLLDAYDGYKKAILDVLRGGKALKGPLVAPLATDLDAWTPNHKKAYASLLGVEEAAIVETESAWTDDAATHIDEVVEKLNGNTEDVFLDPNTGEADEDSTTWKNKKAKADNYFRKADFNSLLTSKPFGNRVLLVFRFYGRNAEHSWESTQRTTEQIAKSAGMHWIILKGRSTGFLFFTSDLNRHETLKKALDGWTGGLPDYVLSGTTRS